MKKELIKLSALATIGLVMASCSNEEANKKAAEADNAAIQTLVDTKNQALDTEVATACDAKVNEAAQVIVDSLAKAKPAAGKTVAAPVKKAPAKTTPAPAKNPKASGMGGTSSTVTKEQTANKAKGMGTTTTVPVTKEETKAKAGKMGTTN